MQHESFERQQPTRTSAWREPFCRHPNGAAADKIPGAPLVRQGYGVLNAWRTVNDAGREIPALAHAHLQPPRVEAGKIIFFYHNDEAKRVMRAEEFNNWNAAQIRFNKPKGIWRAEITAPPPGR